MTRSVYIASAEGESGKSTVALGMLELLVRRVGRVGVFRPIVRAGHQPDYVLEMLIAQDGVDVEYAIHPVAGRMPGHMNVLLAEANVPYDQLKEMDEINPEFPQTDVALVIGANDVTNPAARSGRSSPIYGMPILDVDKAASVIVMKRSMNPGFAGIDNELYLDPRTTMLFGDAKDSVVKLIAAVKAQ